MTVVIPIRFREKDLKMIDELVKSRIFKSRSEAIRNLSLGAAESRYTALSNPDLNEAVEVILDSLKRDRSTFCITLERKVAEFIAEGRERL